MVKTMKYTTTEEIREAFIKKGWSDVHFEAVKLISGKQCFKMIETGTIYNDRGKIEVFNIKPLEKPIIIARGN